MRATITRYIGLCAFLLVGLASCHDEALVSGTDAYEGNTTLSATIVEAAESVKSRTFLDVEGLESGTAHVLWQQNDTIGVFGNGGTRNAVFRNLTAGNSATANFNGTMTSSDRPQYAYYPYRAANNGATVNALQGVLPAVQPFNPETGKLTGDYKYGVPSTADGTDFAFHHLFAMLRIHLNVSGTPLVGERLNRLELSVKDPSGNERPLVGTFTFSAVDGTVSQVTATSGTVQMPWTTNPLLSDGASYTGFLTVMPEVKMGDSISVTVVSDAHRATFTAACLVDFERETLYNVPLDLQYYAAQAEKFNYQVTEFAAIHRFSFNVADNAGKLLDNKTTWNSQNNPQFDAVSEYEAVVSSDSISLMIPYLYDFTLVPTFETSENAIVTVNGKEQVSGQSTVDFSHPVTYTVTAGGTSRDYIVSIINTGLPIVVLNQSVSGDFSDVYQGGVNLGGTNIGGTLVNTFVDFKIRGKDTEWVEDDELTVYNANGTVNLETALCGVRLRGNTTQAYPKKPFAVKFVKKQAVLGMPAHKRWVLLANWLDHSMIRNAVAFDVAHAIEQGWQTAGISEGIPWNVHGLNVELVMDGHHVGNYYLCEQIKIDGNRLNIQEAYEDVSNPTFETCGYLLELDNNYDETYKFITPHYSIPFMFKDDLPDETIFGKVQSKILGIEQNIYDGNFEDVYRDLDIYSLIDQLIIWELTMNREYVEPRSVYYFMDGDSRLKAGPVWDFDRGTFQNNSNAATQGSDRVKPYDEWIYWLANPTSGITSASGFNEDTYSAIFYPKLVTDPAFIQTLQERWTRLLPYLQGVVNNIRAYGESMAKSYDVNNAMWPTTKAAIQKHKSGFTDWSGDENISAYADVIENMVQVYQARLDGMNTLITSGKFTK